MHIKHNKYGCVICSFVSYIIVVTGAVVVCESLKYDESAEYDARRILLIFFLIFSCLSQLFMLMMLTLMPAVLLISPN